MRFESAFFQKNLILLFFLGMFICPVYASQEPGESVSVDLVEDALWKEALAAFEAGNATDSKRLFRLCLIGNVQPAKAAELLGKVLASSSVDLIKGRALNELNEDEIRSAFSLQNEIASLSVSGATEWQKLLQIALLMKKDDLFIISGMAFLDRIEQGMPVEISEEFIDLVKKLEKRLTKDEHVLYRLQICRSLSGIEQTAEEYKAKLAAAQLEAEAKSIRILGLAEVSMAVGELEAAKKFLDQVKSFDPGYSGLDELYKKLELAHRLQKMLGDASEALRNQRFEDAAKICQAVLKIDGNNIFARNILQQIEEARQRKGTGGSASDKIALKVRKLESEIKKAEKEQDFAQIRQLIKELLIIRSDFPEYRARLEEIEKEIALSRLHADDRFKMAQNLYEQGEFQQLRFFLNRNPGLMSSMERLFEIWEMRLMANFHTGHLEPVELKNSALELKKKAKKSFAASYVLMKLALAENRLSEARTYYDEAREIKPKFSGLKWPGWLLWMHGDGRPVVVIVLVIMLFLMIKLIRPAFAWFESTYWFRTAMLAKIFPSLALRSLEGCFGVIKENSEREKLFRMLINCSIASRNKAKAKRYAENLLELKPEDSQALDVLVSEWLVLPDAGEEKLLLICGYCVKNSDQRDLFEKAGVILRRGKRIRVEHIEFLKHYIRHFPEDVEMMHVAGRSLLEIPAMEMPDTAVAMIETAWRKTDSDELWWSLWRTLMFCGRFDQAIQITLEVLEKRRPVKPAALLEVFDKSVYGELRHILDLMSLYDHKKVLEAVKTVRKFRYFNQRMADEVLNILEGLAREEDLELSGAARDSADHVRNRSKASIIAINKIMALENSFAENFEAAEAAECKPVSIELESDPALNNDAMESDSNNADFCGETQVDETPLDDFSESGSRFSFEDLNSSNDSEEEIFSVGDLLSSVNSGNPEKETFAAGNSSEPDAEQQNGPESRADFPSEEPLSSHPEPQSEFIDSHEMPEEYAINYGFDDEKEQLETETFSEIAEESIYEAPGEISQDCYENETLRISEEQVRISDTRHRLFAELDGMQPPVEPSKEWLAYLKNAPKGNGLFAALDE